MDASNQDDENESESESESESEEETDIIPKDDKKSEIETFKKIIVYLKPGENILKAIKRLGNSSKAEGSTTGGATLSASQRWLKKKNQTEATAKKDSNITPESIKADKEALEKLTGFANYFIDKGYYDIYEETFEKIQNKIDASNQEAKKNADAFDMFADEVDEKNLAKSTDEPSTSSNAQVLQGIFLKNIY
jgi:CD2 antigen cytoplasmic tail-binding protein 2